ncbi:DNA-processing protein DprA [Vibrio maerlii]|uniref:DNA-processing protein DprA n=1 Tax=Vibrio maerlii TaxID=2231648 RepID=UPI000E3B6077|nr:DNA-processing protein DprA [Vibrio maerlii]
MSEQRLAAWMALAFVPRLGPRKLSQLQSIDSPEQLIQLPGRELHALGLSSTQIQFLHHHSQREVEACLEWRERSDGHILALCDQLYPPLLKEIASPPPLLFVRGKVSVLTDPQVAIVGSRNASLEALELSSRFASDLVKSGLVVTSGLALGVDGYAHDGALKQQGETVAVLGTGLERVYPARHRGLAARIMEQGALVSEFRPITPARPENFPRRNRIISGLSAGTLVIEAAEKSGSLITAKYALEQNREVFALPWSVDHITGRGNNLLIKSGATLVHSADEVVAEIDSLINWSYTKQGDLFSKHPATQPASSELFVSNEDVTQEQLPFPQLFANVGNEATPVDILAQRTNIPVHEVMMQLLELELLGHVVAVSGGYIRNGGSKL